MKKEFRILILFIFILGIFFPVVYANAGTISSSYKYAWSDQIGYINFAPLNGGVTVTSSVLSGYAWSENTGYINFAPINGGVFNDGNGNLSGSAWGEGLGYIDFDNVSIDPASGRFSGTATGTLVGTINFDCPNYCDVRTDWRPGSLTATPGVVLIGPVGVTLNNPSLSGFPVDVTLPIPKNLQGIKSLGVYWFNETNKQWMLVPEVKFSKTEAVFKFYGKAQFKIFDLNTTTPKIQKTKQIIVPSLPIKNKPVLDKSKQETVKKDEIVQQNIIVKTKETQKTFIQKVIIYVESAFINLFKFLQSRI